MFRHRLDALHKVRRYVWKTYVSSPVKGSTMEATWRRPDMAADLLISVIESEIAPGGCEFQVYPQGKNSTILWEGIGLPEPKICPKRAVSKRRRVLQQEHPLWR